MRLSALAALVGLTSFVAAPATHVVRLDAAMPKPKIGDMSSHLLLDPAETYTMIVPKLNAGRYAFVCLPHQANMRGALVVTP